MKALYTIIGIIVGLVIGIFVPKPVSDKTMDHGMMHKTMDTMSMSLEGKTGESFDQEFLKQMIVHHQGAIDMASKVLVQSERDELRTLAQDIIVTQDKEIRQMQAWQEAWFTNKE